jgi:hypothetical protein
MYVVTKERMTWFDVEWSSLDEAGEPVTNTIRMKGVLVDLDQFNAFVQVALIDSSANGNEGTQQPVKFIHEVSRDWAEIVDEQRRPFTFNPDNLNVLIQAPGFLLGWTMSYVKAWNGQAKAREKNSDSSPADGRAGAARRPRRPRKSS